MVLKREHAEMDEARREAQHELAECTTKLDRQLSSERERTLSLENRLFQTENCYKDTVKNLESEISMQKEKLKLAEAQAADAQTERNAAKQELTEVHDRTRRLLNSLDLNNDLTKTAMSVEHARNISYARRRRPSAHPLSASFNSLAANGQPLLYRRTPSGLSLLTSSNNADSRRNSTTSLLSSHKLKNGFNDIQEQPTGKDDNLNAALKVTAENSDRQTTLTCTTCGKTYDESSNYDGVCLRHQTGAKLLNEVTSLQVWSCCKSAQTFRGCIKSRHTPRYK